MAFEKGKNGNPAGKPNGISQFSMKELEKSVRIVEKNCFQTINCKDNCP
jgi:hypothetical protein